jgi:4-diphosphocytidyl-2-C-methyl-D-erythritol kinase
LVLNLAPAGSRRFLFRYLCRDSAGKVFMMLEKQSPCKVNLLLNILGRRNDGFHELETVMHPVRLFDRIGLQRAAHGIELTCSQPGLSAGPENLVYRAAAHFLEVARIKEGVRLHLEKNIPLAAGLGGGSGNAAVTLAGMNELFGNPLPVAHLTSIAADLGSDVPFFLQEEPALATGRGERIQPLECFPAMKGAAFLLIHPGFGISTAWAYQQLPRFPEALNGQRGRAAELVSLLQTADLRSAGAAFYNSLEAPALEKYPLLALYQDFLRSAGALAVLMSGSGSTTFAVVPNLPSAEALAEEFRANFGPTPWLAMVPI